MKLKLLAAVAVVVALAAGAVLVATDFLASGLVPRSALRDKFAAAPLPAMFTRELFDLGITDIDGDDHLDIFSSNHNTRQILWVSDGKGGYRDMLTAAGLDQSPAFPGAEISDKAPEVNEPGLYIYWQGRNLLSQFPLVVRAHRMNELGRLDGSLSSYSAFGRPEADAFIVQQSTAQAAREGEMPRHTLTFSSDRDGALTVTPASPGVPITVHIGAAFPLDRVYVGPQKVRPQSREFDLVLQDRHALAWADVNGDGLLDVYMSRGAIGGTLRKFPPSFQARIQDELLLRQPGGRYVNSTASSGVEKRGCSARKATWIDFDRDGLLDLFVNCMERGFVEGEYGKQLYRHVADGKFVDVAARLGLDLAHREVIDFAWVDIDNDGFPDLVTHEAQGFFLYKSAAGAKFTEQSLGRGKFVRADRPHIRGTSNEYWFVDGKLTVADFDGDGDADVFMASKMGNVLLLNDGKGGLSLVDTASRGLPGESATANWVDFDNDGLMDLHTVPQGLFRQRADHSFERTGLLALPDRKYMAAIVNWADLDNDGRRDAVMALLENPSLWNWWQQRRKTTADKFTWKLAAYLNRADTNQWLAVRLAGGPGNPQAIGARVTIHTGAGQQTQVVGLNDGAFFSQGHYRLYFGLGSSGRVDSMHILWPNGQTQELRDVAAKQLHVIRQATAERQEATK